jgi:hypothetical protein
MLSRHLPTTENAENIEIISSEYLYSSETSRKKTKKGKLKTLLFQIAALTVSSTHLVYSNFQGVGVRRTRSMACGTNADPQLAAKKIAPPTFVPSSALQTSAPR